MPTRMWQIAFIILILLFFPLSFFGQDSRFEVFLRKSDNSPQTGASVYCQNLASGGTYTLSEVVGGPGLYRKDNVPLGVYAVYVNGALKTTNRFHGTNQIYLTLAQIDPDVNYQIDTQGYENLSVTTPKIADSSVTMPKLSTAVLNYIGSGGNVVNNPDDLTLENKSAFSIGIKDLYNVAEDTTYLKDYATLEGNGTQVFLAALSGSNPNGSEWFMLVDSILPEIGGVAYDATAAAGKQWVSNFYLQTRLVTPLQFGAILNDGTATNDAPAIQKAINFHYTSADSGGTVLVPSGRYIFKTSVYLKHRVNLIGTEGTAFRGSSSIASKQLEAVIFEGHSSLNDALVVIDSTSGVYWASTFWQNNCLIRGITFKGGSMTSLSTAYGGLLTANCVIGFKVENCTFYQSPRHGIGINHAIAFGISGGSFINNGSAVTDGTGIYIQGGAGDCYIENAQFGLNDWGIYLAGGNYTTRIQNNKIFNNNSGGLYAFSSSSLDVLGNDFHDQHQKHHIILSSVTNSTVIGNLIWAGADTLVYTAGIYGVAFSGNSFANSQYGILDPSSVSSGNSIIGNTFYNLTVRGIEGLYSDFNTIQGNTGADSRTDNYLTAFNTTDSTLELAKDGWLTIPIDTLANRTDGLTLSGDTIFVFTPGLYRISANFSIAADSAVNIEVAPWVTGTIKSQFIASLYSPDSMSLTTSILGYEFLADTDYVDFKICNKTDDSNITIKTASYAIEQLGLRDRNYILGSELITNGDFATGDLTGWSNSSVTPFNTFANSGNQLSVINTAGTSQRGGATDAARFAITAGTRYVFTFKLIRNSGSSTLNVRWRYTAEGSIYKSWGSFAPGEYRFVHLATESTDIAVSFDVAAAANWLIDNVSVREAE